MTKNKTNGLSCSLRLNSTKVSLFSQAAVGSCEPLDDVRLVVMIACVVRVGSPEPSFSADTQTTQHRICVVQYTGNVAKVAVRNSEQNCSVKRENGRFFCMTGKTRMELQRQFPMDYLRAPRRVEFVGVRIVGASAPSLARGFRHQNPYNKKISLFSYCILQKV